MDEIRFLNPNGKIEIHKHWLPHWQQGAITYFVTWHLADSIPHEKLQQWLTEKDIWSRMHPKPWNEIIEAEYHEKFSRNIDRWLDEGMGSCLLRKHEISIDVAESINHFDGDRYIIHAFVVMPNHVHVLFQLAQAKKIETIVQSWKSYSARKINAKMGRKGSLWQADYWDRMIRNETHFLHCKNYIQRNPAMAKLSKEECILYVKQLENEDS